MTLAPEPKPDDQTSGNEEGLIHDEYTDDSFEDVDSIDALDVRSALRDERLLDDLADDSDGIEEMDVLPVSAGMDTIDSGARHRPNDDAEMGLGAEAHSAEELEEAALGHELRGKAAHMRDGEVHGEMLFDSPDAREPN